VKLPVFSDLTLGLALVAFQQHGTNRLQGVNACFWKDMWFGQKKPKHLVGGNSILDIKTAF
jgi:hypothetical protein